MNFEQHLPLTLQTGRDAVSNRLLAEYGSVFAAANGVTPPDRIVFHDELDVERFYRGLSCKVVEFTGFSMELQSAAATALLAARADASRSGLTISPRGADSARRSYAETVALWLSRVEPALAHWVAVGKLDFEVAEYIRSLSAVEQIPVVLELEAKEIFFSKDLSKSILHSVAAPGASQHLSLLAFDVAEYNNESVREILSEHGWHRTVVSDLPHFTFLGMKERELSSRGLKYVESAMGGFWVPDLG